MAYARRVTRATGAAVFAALLGGCGASTAVIESADAAPPERPASAVAVAEASPEADCTPPPLPPKPANWDDDWEGPSFQAIVDQEAVGAALEPLNDLAEHPVEGFASLRNEGGRHGAILWKGTPPPEIAAMAGMTEDCVRIDVLNVPYSAQDVRAAGKRVFDAERSATGRRLWSAGAVKGYTGLRLGYEVVPTGAEADALRARLSELAGMPVTFEQTGPILG